jgi:hypothetical protein
MVRNPPDLPPAGARDALLDHSAAQVRIDQAPFGVADRFLQRLVANGGLSREPDKRLVLEYPHMPRSTPQGQFLVYYNT